MREAPQDELLGLDIQELSALVAKMGQPAYRARQLYEGLYRARVTDLAEITTLPQSFRAELQGKGYKIGEPRIEKRFQSSDGTIRYLVAFADGQSVETVWMPEGDGGENEDGSDADWKRGTICVSSQVGCAVD